MRVVRVPAVDPPCRRCGCRDNPVQEENGMWICAHCTNIWPTWTEPEQKKDLSLGRGEMETHLKENPHRSALSP